MDENSPMLAESQIALAECYLSKGERTQARSLVERAQRIHQSHPNLGEHMRRSCVPTSLFGWVRLQGAPRLQSANAPGRG